MRLFWLGRWSGARLWAEIREGARLSTSSSARSDRSGSSGGGAAGAAWVGRSSWCCSCSSSTGWLTFSCSSNSSSPGCSRAVHRQSAGHSSCARRGTHSANCAEDCSWLDVPVISSDWFPQSRGSIPAPDPLSGEHSYCATDFVDILQVQFLDKVEICPLLRRQVQFSWWSWVVDMPVCVQRQVLSFSQNFHIFYVNVDSDPEAVFALENLNIISTSSWSLSQSTSLWKNFIFST